MLKDPLIKNKGKSKVIKHISKDNIWETPLKDPKRAYFDALDQPARKIPKILNEDILIKKILFKKSSK